MVNLILFQMYLPLACLSSVFLCYVLKSVRIHAIGALGRTQTGNRGKKQLIGKGFCLYFWSAVRAPEGLHSQET